MKPKPARNNLVPMPGFEDRLQDGERLLWQGTPDPRLFLQSRLGTVALFTLPLIPVVLLGEYWSASGSLPLMSPVTWAYPFGFWLVMCWVFAGPAREQARTAAYALTDRRVFIRRLESLTSKDWRVRIDEIPLDRVRLRLRLRGSGHGTVTLGAPLWELEKALRGIADAAAVYAQIREAQAALAAPTETDAPYYARSESSASCGGDWKTEDMLRRGERVLWQGSVDAAAEARSGRWTVLGIVLILAVLGGWILSWFGVWTWLWQALMLAGSVAVVVPVARSDARNPNGKPLYVLTTRRVLVVKRIKNGVPGIEERELAETKAMRLKHGRGGVGTIVFEKKTRLVGQNVETYEFSFQQIADAETVFEQIRAAAAGYN